MKYISSVAFNVHILADLPYIQVTFGMALSRYSRTQTPSSPCHCPLSRQTSDVVKEPMRKWYPTSQVRVAKYPWEECSMETNPCSKYNPGHLFAENKFCARAYQNNL